MPARSTICPRKAFGATGSAVGPGRGAFTIIELVVVISIMFILIAITLPAIRSLTRNNNQKQATNELTALIANAHSLAVQSHTPAGVVIYEDWANAPTTPKKYAAQSSAQLVIFSGYNATTGATSFVRAPRTGPQQLPVGIKVAALDDDATNLFKIQDPNAANQLVCRIILFDANGQLVMRSNLIEDASISSADTAATSWNMTASLGVSSPGMILFNGNDLQAATDNKVVKDQPTLTQWMKQNSDVVIINAYTGNVIR